MPYRGTDRPAAPRVRLTGLSLVDFRNYAALDLALDAGPVVLTGENGSGKTNLLEAISMLAPGRGLRRATFADLARAGADNGFAIHAEIDGPEGEAALGTGTFGQAGGDGTEATRRVRVNGAPAKSAEDLLDWLRVVWISPAMDGLFTGPAAERRRFLDRLVLTIDPAHGRRAADYEKAMRGRNRLLADDHGDAAWLSAIESQMAETGVAIAAARAELLRLLEATIARQPVGGPFPMASIAIDGALESRVASVAAADIEEEFRETLARSRGRDRAAGRALDGPHRSDLAVRHGPKDMPAELCSTGEQKALLIGLVLSHARLTGELAGMAPVLLLDEIAAHLDESRRAALFELLDDLNGQAFMTGTEASLFDSLAGRAQFLSVSNGTVLPSR